MAKLNFKFPSVGLLALSLCAVGPVARADSSLPSILADLTQMVTASEGAPSSVIAFQATPVQLTGKSITADSVDAIFDVGPAVRFAYASWRLGHPFVQAEPVTLAEGLPDVGANQDWEALGARLTAIPGFAAEPGATESRYLFVTSAGYTQGAQMTEVGSFPFTQDAVRNLLAGLAPGARIAVASVVDLTAAQSCKKHSSPYWIIDLATGKILLHGTDSPCTIAPGGVSSGG